MVCQGIVRRLDELGRIVLPIELRRMLVIEQTDGLEFFVDGDRIILQKYKPKCCFCDGTDDVALISGKHVCKNCLKALGNMASE